MDHTEKGWFIQYIDRSPEVLKRQAEAQKKEKMELDDEERTGEVHVDSNVGYHSGYYHCIDINFVERS